MATNPTKILLYDLDADLGKIIDDLMRLQGDFPSLYDRLINIGVDLLDEDTKRVVQDLIDGYDDSGKLTIQRIIDVNKRVDDLEFLLQIALTDGQDGTEDFTYDPEYQNVTKHTVKDALGAVVFTIDYNYADLATGKLSYSEKKFKDAKDNDIVVRKDYTYDENENIKKIVTATSITPPEAPVLP
jgi:hypothetical protein